MGYLDTLESEIGIFWRLMKILSKRGIQPMAKILRVMGGKKVCARLMPEKSVARARS